MKTILQIIVILLVAAVVSSGVYALVESTSLVSSSEAERGVPSQMTGADTQSMPTRPESGDEHSVSLSRGLGDVGGTLAKLSVVTALILLMQKAVDLLRRPKLKPTA